MPAVYKGITTESCDETNKNTSLNNKIPKSAFWQIILLVKKMKTPFSNSNKL